MQLITLPTSVFAIFKIFVLLGLALYALFAAIMVRQEGLMDKVVDEAFEPILKVLVLIHFLLALGLFLLAIVIL